MARWCARYGAQVQVVDTREQPPGLAELQAQCPQVQFQAVSSFSVDLIEGKEIRAVCRSPGLSPAQIAPVLGAARAVGLPVWGELDLFWMGLQCLKVASQAEPEPTAEVQETEVETDAEAEPIEPQQSSYEPKILAITGTNGKTTVTSLTGQLVARSGKTVAVAGNIGPTLLDTLTQHMDAQTLPQVWVLELSSFQLDGVTGFMPTMGVVLNLTQDHLDWHGDMAAYGAAKARIFGAHSIDAPPMLLNRDDTAVVAMRPALIKNKPQRTDISFGSDLPQRPGDYGIETVGGMTWLVKALEADETQKRRKGDEVEIHLQRFMPADALRIRGRHNALNALVALALASAAGCSLSAMLYGLREYRGEPHRVEPVCIVRDVEYFDDSKGTNVGATAAALNGLGAERKIVVILGGEGKGQDFSPLVQPVSLYARAVILIGRDAPLIEQALAGSGVRIQGAGSMEEAVSLAAQIAHAGDAVLLSPACASFDMFKDYKHRAEVYVDAVKKLADDAGVSILEGA
ncbi:UDP-N-acetylmuramoyl-L-alanine--D-glutamate ligase [Variovorax sp. PCZ-1]|nr:UDP-N-acetylmuramoyl-L-alanine--D-glutamate ligase [Variovorax sp. PCZ-1]MBS7808150.1 UDP-N-acetylmuramoyl-L-alanine--D-glutamate ligase [Variovorax sp. PCZ-1]